MLHLGTPFYDGFPFLEPPNLGSSPLWLTIFRNTLLQTLITDPHSLMAMGAPELRQGSALAEAACLRASQPAMRKVAPLHLL